MTQNEMKKWIDGATLEELLRKWRFDPSGSPWFQGEVGSYFSEVMSEKRSQDPAAWTAASKRIGW